MRRQNDILERQQIRVNLGLAFKHIEPRCRDLPAAQRGGQRRVIDDAAARDVDQRRCRLHQGQLGSADAVVRGGRIRQHQDQVVGGFKQLVAADEARLAVGLSRRVELRAVVVDDLHAETVRAAFGNALPDPAHTQNAQRGMMNVRAGKHVVAPLRPFAGAQVMFAFRNAPGGGHQQGEAEVGGGFGQHVGRVGSQHAGSAHRVDVEVVVADGHVGADSQAGASCQHLGVDAVAAGGESAGFALQMSDQLRLVPYRVGLVGLDLEMLLQCRDDLGEHGARNQNFEFAH